MMWVLVALAVGYSALLGGMYVGQRGLMYHPNDRAPMPAAYGLADMAAVQVPAHDGLKLHGWWKAPREASLPTLLYFHGNAGNLDDRAGRARFLIDQGYGLLMLTYRYNAGAGGAPSEEALIADGRASVDWLGQEQAITRDTLVLYGESLGSGVVSALAGEGRAAAVIIDGGYDSAANVAQAAYPFVPAKWLLKDKFDNAAHLARAEGVAKLIVHGARDRIVPPSRATALYQAAAEPKRLEILENAAHSDLYEHGMVDLLRDFLAETFPQ
jgi:fermentation-respiration switch protein FrsA (DUF1100 family)